MNYLLHCIIIEIFMAIYCYLFGSNAFHVPQKNKKYLAMTVITKSCLYNVITLYLCYIGVIENTYRYGLLNIFCIVVIFAIYKLITGLDYIKIIIGTMLIDTFCGITIVVPYTFIYSVAKDKWNFFISHAKQDCPTKSSISLHFSSSPVCFLFHSLSRLFHILYFILRSSPLHCSRPHQWKDLQAVSDQPETVLPSSGRKHLLPSGMR